jgi:hypothetical protein
MLREAYITGSSRSRRVTHTIEAVRNVTYHNLLREPKHDNNSHMDIHIATN